MYDHERSCDRAIKLRKASCAWKLALADSSAYAPGRYRCKIVLEGEKVSRISDNMI